MEGITFHLPCTLTFLMLVGSDFNICQIPTEKSLGINSADFHSSFCCVELAVFNVDVSMYSFVSHKEATWRSESFLCYVLSRSTKPTLKMGLSEIQLGLES